MPHTTTLRCLQTYSRLQHNHRRSIRQTDSVQTSSSAGSRPRLASYFVSRGITYQDASSCAALQAAFFQQSLLPHEIQVSLSTMCKQSLTLLALHLRCSTHHLPHQALWKQSCSACPEDSAQYSESLLELTRPSCCLKPDRSHAVGLQEDLAIIITNTKRRRRASPPPGGRNKENN